VLQSTDKKIIQSTAFHTQCDTVATFTLMFKYKILIVLKIYQGNQIKGVEMGKAYSTHVKRRNAYNSSAGKIEGNRDLKT
jgi:hypothetical protein